MSTEVPRACPSRAVSCLCREVRPFVLTGSQYNLSDTSLVSRFGSVLRAARKGEDPLGVFDDASDAIRQRPIIVFSGDAFSPSLESSVLRGEHMVPVLNELGIDLACYGNHGKSWPATSGKHRHLLMGFQTLTLEKHVSTSCRARRTSLGFSPTCSTKTLVLQSSTYYHKLAKALY